MDSRQQSAKHLRNNVTMDPVTLRPDLPVSSFGATVLIRHASNLCRNDPLSDSEGTLISNVSENVSIVGDMSNSHLSVHKVTHPAASKARGEHGLPKGTSKLG